jgi:transcriptional regulator with XRE-family HTH domain
VETTTLRVGELRQLMRARGVTSKTLAQEAGISEASLSSVLTGRTGLGRYRRERIEGAILRLRLYETPPAARPERKPPEFRVPNIRSTRINYEAE